MGDTRSWRRMMRRRFSPLESWRSSRPGRKHLCLAGQPTDLKRGCGGFPDTASRALDPQVHTHFVTATATWDLRTKSWRALTEFEMVSAIRYAGKVYQNEMAPSCLALGYEIGQIRDNQGAVTGFRSRGFRGIRIRFQAAGPRLRPGFPHFARFAGTDRGEIHSITTETRDAKLAEITTRRSWPRSGAALAG